MPFGRSQSARPLPSTVSPFCELVPNRPVSLTSPPAPTPPRGPAPPPYRPECKDYEFAFANLSCAYGSGPACIGPGCVPPPIACRPSQQRARKQHQLPVPAPGPRSAPPQFKERSAPGGDRDYDRTFGAPATKYGLGGVGEFTPVLPPAGPRPVNGLGPQAQVPSWEKSCSRTGVFPRWLRRRRQ